MRAVRPTPSLGMAPKSITIKEVSNKLQEEKVLTRRTYLWKERALEIEFEVPMSKGQGTPDLLGVLEACRRW